MKIKLEIWVSLTAMITAIAAVVVAIIQTQLMHEEAALARKHSRLSVKPSLLIYSQSRVGDDDGSFSFGIQNQGLGPAELDGFSVELNGQRMNNWFDFFNKATDGQVFLRGDKRNVPDISETNVISGLIIPADKNLQLIKLESNAKIAQQLRAADANAVISVCYCSFYNECWSTDNQSSKAAPVESCQAYQPLTFSNLDGVAPLQSAQHATGQTGQ